MARVGVILVCVLAVIFTCNIESLMAETMAAPPKDNTFGEANGIKIPKEFNEIIGDNADIEGLLKELNHENPKPGDSYAGQHPDILSLFKKYGIDIGDSMKEGEEVLGPQYTQMAMKLQEKMANANAGMGLDIEGDIDEDQIDAAFENLLKKDDYKRDNHGAWKGMEDLEEFSLKDLLGDALDTGDMGSDTPKPRKKKARKPQSVKKGKKKRTKKGNTGSGKIKPKQKKRGRRAKEEL